MKTSRFLALAVVLICSAASISQDYLFQTLEIPDSKGAAALGINNHELIVGSVQTSEDILSFVWQNGVATFPTFELDFALLTDVNDAGMLVGTGANEESFELPSFTFLDGVLDTFSFPGSLATFATGINNAGSVVGAFETFDFDSFQSFVKVNDNLSEFTVPGFEDVVAADINDAGTIVGVLYDGEASDGFIWMDGVVQVLAHPDGDSELMALNNSGLLVGGVFPENGPGQAFIYDGNEFTDIAFPGADETIVWGVNDAGTLVGSYFQNDQEFAFLARPVPEPHGAGLLLCGLLMLCTRRSTIQAR